MGVAIEVLPQNHVKFWRSRHRIVRWSKIKILSGCAVRRSWSRTAQSDVIFALGKSNAARNDAKCRDWDLGLGTWTRTRTRTRRARVCVARKIGPVARVGFSCLVRQNRRCSMLPFACMPWHRGGWYVTQCWILLTRGRVSGIADVCVCWLHAFAPNGEHNIPYQFSSLACVIGVGFLFLFVLPIKR